MRATPPHKKRIFNYNNQVQINSKLENFNQANQDQTTIELEIFSWEKSQIN